MGSQSSKFGPESIVGSKRENTSNILSSPTKAEYETKIKKSIDETHKQESGLVNTSFKWAYGGHSVFVTGTFTGWKDHVPLHKVGHEFNTILPLPKGVYYYKFIVDGEWKFSPDDLTAPDEHGNINNIVDTTAIASVQKIIGSANDLRKQSLADEPEKSDNPFTEAASPLPPHLMGVYFLNSRDKKLKAENDLILKLENMKLEDVPLPKNTGDPRREFVGNKTELAPPTHVTLNHLVSFGPFVSNGRNFDVTATTQRFKSKYATIHFYSSKFSQKAQNHHANGNGNGKEKHST